MEKTNVAIVGLGTVGSGVARLLLDHGDRTARHAGRTMWLKKAVVRDLQRQRNVDLPADVLTSSLDDVINDNEITVVAQLIGGLEPARTIMLSLLESGKDIVTANKALLAEHGPELFTRARELDAALPLKQRSQAAFQSLQTSANACQQIKSVHSREFSTAQATSSSPKWEKTICATMMLCKKHSVSAMQKAIPPWMLMARMQHKNWRSGTPCVRCHG